MRVLVFDTETTGINRPKDFSDPSFSKVVQICGLLFEYEAETPLFDAEHRFVLKPTMAMNFIVSVGDEVEVAERAVAVHGISKQRAQEIGVMPMNAAFMFTDLLSVSDRIVGHNIAFDISIVKHLLVTNDIEPEVLDKPEAFCTMQTLKPIMKMTPKVYGDWKQPKLSEAHQYIFGEVFDDAHDAYADTLAAARVYFALSQMGVAKDGFRS